MIVAALIASMLTTQAALAAFIKLSGAMPNFGDVSDFKISPDGQYVVYRADQDTDGVIELYSVPLAGGTPVKLNGILPTGSSVQNDYQISPDSSRVIYRAPQDTFGVYELYSVPIAGPTSGGVKLNVALVVDGDVLENFQISPNSKQVVYRADQQTEGVFELYSVPLTGPAINGVKINNVLVTYGDVWAFQISPDSSSVVYRADQDTNDVDELYSVPLTGPAGAGVKLNGALVTGGDMLNFQISPDSSRVVYVADQQTDEVGELYSVPLVGPAGAGVKLNGAMVTGGEVSDYFQISVDSSRVVYWADQDTDGVLELYSVPLAGPAGAGVKLNGALVAGGDVWDFQASPDSSRVVYRADQQTNDVFELYSVPLTGPASAGVKLNGALVTFGDVWAIRVSPDSSRVVYQADQQTDEVGELYSVPLAGPASSAIKLNEALVTGGDVLFNYYQISSDSSRVIYQADQDVDGVIELYRVPLAGGAGSKLNGSLVTGGGVFDFQISPDSSRVVYMADQDTNEIFELYVADDGQTKVGFSAAAAMVAEGAGGKSLTVELSGAAVLPVTVDYAATGGTATGSGVDYTLAAGSLTFNPGQTSQTIDVNIVEDTLYESDETVILTLSNPQNAALGTLTTLTLTINDDDYGTYLPLVKK
jgi:Tol biopolymer transport system component